MVHWDPDTLDAADAADSVDAERSWHHVHTAVDRGSLVDNTGSQDSADRRSLGDLVARPHCHRY